MIGVGCHPADMPDCQTIVGFHPGHPRIVRAENAVLRAGKDNPSLRDYHGEAGSFHFQIPRIGLLNEL